MAWYKTGTVSFTQGEKSLVGSGTNWIDQKAGWWVWLRNEDRPNEIAAIVSSTELTLTNAVEATTATEVEYLIIPTHAYSKILADKVAALITSVQSAEEGWAAIVGDFSASVYQLWLDEGNTGTVTDFFEDLKGTAGLSVYEEWEAIVENNGQTFAQFLATLKGSTGDSAYDAWEAIVENNGQTFDQFIDHLSAGAVSATASNKADAETAKTDAETAAALAQKWASEIEDTEVTTGLYSALHHAAKAAVSAASTAADVVTSAATLASIQTVFDNFDDRYLGVFDTAGEPLLDNDGDALQLGAMYLNSDTDDLMFYNGAQWKSPEATAEEAAAAAQTAQGLAEAAQGLAEGARDAAITAKNDAVTAKGLAEDAKADAEAAQGAAETAGYLR
jgi:hypothetical protein